MDSIPHYPAWLRHGAVSVCYSRSPTAASVNRLSFILGPAHSKIIRKSLKRGEDYGGKITTMVLI